MKKRLLPLLVLPLLLQTVQPVTAEQPESGKEEAMYFLMTDRFMNGDRSNDQDVDYDDPSAYHGGDYKGIHDQLDYIEELGMTSIVISPVMENEPSSYHGYKVTDYSAWNEHFGTEEELASLIEEAHNRDISVIAEFPATRVSTAHVWLQDPAKADWFSGTTTAAPDWLGDMALINTQNKEAQEALASAAAALADNTGLDGFFFNDAASADPSFWSAFDEKMPELFLIGDMTGVSMEKAAEYEQAGLDAVTASWMRDAFRSQFKTVDQPSADVQQLIAKEEDTLLYPDRVIRLADDALTNRFTLEMAEENMFPGTRWQMALSYLYALPGTPALFYGSEIAQNGRSGPESHDLMNFRTDQELADYIRESAKLRMDLPALQSGTYESLYDKDGMSVIKRYYNEDGFEETVVVAVNNTGETQRISIPAEELDEEKELRGLLNGDLIRAADGTFTMIIDREEAEVYALAERTGINYAFIAAMAAVWVVFIAFLFIVWKRGKKAAGRE